MQPVINNTTIVSGYLSSSHYRDEVTYNKIQKHLNDEHDLITDEDIRNIKIQIGGKQIEDLSAELEHLIKGKL